MTTLRACARRLGPIMMLALVLLSCPGCGVMENGAAGLPLPGGPDTGNQPVKLTLHFASVEGLVPKSSVRFNNVAVGQVEGISVDEATWTAVVTATVRGDTGLPDNADAKVRRSSLLGEWFVELSAPDDRVATPLRTGAEIPVARTSASAPVERVLGALSLLLNNGGLPQLNTLVTELNKAFGGNQSEIRALLGDLDEFTRGLDGNRDGIVQALDGLADLSSTLEDNKAQIATTLDELPEGIKVLADQRKDLVQMLRSLDQLSDITVNVIDASKDDTVADLKLLGPVLQKLAQAGPDLPNALKILLTFPFTPGSFHAFRGDYLNLNAMVNLDLASVLETITPASAPAGAASAKPAADAARASKPATGPVTPPAGGVGRSASSATNDIVKQINDLLGSVVGGLP